MNLKSTLLLLAMAGVTSGSMAATDEIVLDLTKATTQLTFDADNGMWLGTYDDDEESIESQCFSFVKNSMGDYKTWWGITASKSADNTPRADYTTYQFSNMALGGIVLDGDGKVKTGANGMPETSGDVPYLVCYGNSGWGRRYIDMTFNDNALYEPVGVYVNFNSYTFYTLVMGDAMCRAFNDGDKYTVTFNGVAADESVKSVTVDLGACENGILSVSRGWTWVDLSELGPVNEIYVDLNSTDQGVYGMNTPSYLCMDKLTVRKAQSGINAVSVDANTLSYDRAAKTVSVADGAFAIIYDVNGNKLMSGEATTYDVSGLSRGVYIIRSGNTSMKFVR
ncbi:MAG: DUF4465 domain-containing protein [Muribaculaceae bacterium]|nr:DUF4465 domain-containing protein [Muribaculaceae bacterium]